MLSYFHRDVIPTAAVCRLHEGTLLWQKTLEAALGGSTKHSAKQLRSGQLPSSDFLTCML
ncbi:hypothetical protein EON65_56875 [archaeon]|nr:MAG: hypothetical protein EON65_56875 [archaeon]